MFPPGDSLTTINVADEMPALLSLDGCVVTKKQTTKALKTPFRGHNCAPRGYMVMSTFFLIFSLFVVLVCPNPIENRTCIFKPYPCVLSEPATPARLNHTPPTRAGPIYNETLPSLEALIVQQELGENNYRGRDRFCKVPGGILSTMNNNNITSKNQPMTLYSSSRKEDTPKCLPEVLFSQIGN